MFLTFLSWPFRRRVEGTSRTKPVPRAVQSWTKCQSSTGTRLATYNLHAERTPCPQKSPSKEPNAARGRSGGGGRAPRSRAEPRVTLSGRPALSRVLKLRCRLPPRRRLGDGRAAQRTCSGLQVIEKHHLPFPCRMSWSWRQKATLPEYEPGIGKGRNHCHSSSVVISSSSDFYLFIRACFCIKAQPFSKRLPNFWLTTHLLISKRQRGTEVYKV